MFAFGRRLIMRRMSNFDEESEYQDFTEMQNRYDADRSRESRNFRYRNAETYDKENDRNKLMYLTDQKEDFKYNFGLFVELGSHEVYMEVYQEGNLQTKLNYSITY